MREKLKDHIETLFAAAPDTESARNLKDEVLQNTLDRYDDARAAGAAEEAAWAEAVEALDGLEAVIRDLGGEPAPADRRGKEPDDAGRSPAVDTLIPAGGCRLRGRVASLDVRYGFGTVAVRTGGGLTTVREEIPGDGRPARIVLENGCLRIAMPAGETEPRGLFGGGRKRRLEIELPAGTAEALDTVRIEAVSADSELTGLKARRAVLASASGNFSLICCEIGTLSATAASGDVSLRKGFWNEGRIATGSGDLSVIGCRLRRLEQYSTSGDVSILTSAAEELVFRTVSGDVDVKGSVRALQAATVSGDLHLVAAAAPERLFFRSTSGDGKLHLPEGTAFTLDLSTVSGSLRTGPFTGEREESSRHTVFRCGGDGPVYEIRTTSGDVSLHVNPAAPGETV